MNRLSKLRDTAPFRVALGLLSVTAGALTVLMLITELSEAETTPQTSAAADYHGVSLVLQPQSLEQMVVESELVVMGAFTGEVEGATIVYPAGVDPKAQDKVAPERLGGFPFTDLRFSVDSSLKGTSPSQLSIRWPGDLVNADGVSYFPGPKGGEMLILFLVRDPNSQDKWSPYRAMWSVIQPVSGSLRYHDAEQTEIGFLRGQSFSDVTRDVTTLGSKP